MNLAHTLYALSLRVSDYQCISEARIFVIALPMPLDVIVSGKGTIFNNTGKYVPGSLFLKCIYKTSAIVDSGIK